MHYVPSEGNMYHPKPFNTPWGGTGALPLYPHKIRGDSCHPS
jgi:hypothetical protein